MAARIEGTRQAYRLDGVPDPDWCSRTSGRLVVAVVVRSQVGHVRLHVRELDLLKQGLNRCLLRGGRPWMKRSDGARRCRIQWTNSQENEPARWVSATRALEEASARLGIYVSVTSNCNTSAPSPALCPSWSATHEAHVSSDQGELLGLGDPDGLSAVPKLKKREALGRLLGNLSLGNDSLNASSEGEKGEERRAGGEWAHPETGEISWRLRYLNNQIYSPEALPKKPLTEAYCEEEEIMFSQAHLAACGCYLCWSTTPRVSAPLETYRDRQRV